MFWSSKKSAEGTWQNGRYTSIKTLGQGGFGITYLARDGLLERKVALKEFFLHGSSRVRGKVTPPQGVSSEVFQDQRSKFIDEARALARFSHQSIVRVQDVFEESGTAFIVMEFLEGHTLMERLRERGPLTPTQGEQLTRQLLEALGEVHRAGLLHRDIKPDNLFMAGERPVLIDFGAARQLKTSGAQGMTAILTPGFAPPEQYFSSGVKYGPPTDLYALAATVLFAMTAELVQPAHERAIDPQPLPIPPAGTSSGFAQALRQSLEFKIEARP